MQLVSPGVQTHPKVLATDSGLEGVFTLLLVLPSAR